MTAKLRRLQAHPNAHKRHSRPAAALSGAPVAAKAPAGAKEAEAKADEEERVSSNGGIRRSSRVQALQGRVVRGRLSLGRFSEREERSPPPPRRSLPALGSAALKGAAAERQMVTRQRAKDILLRAKTLRQR